MSKQEQELNRSLAHYLWMNLADNHIVKILKKIERGPG